MEKYTSTVLNTGCPKKGCPCPEAPMLIGPSHVGQTAKLSTLFWAALYNNRYIEK